MDISPAASVADASQGGAGTRGRLVRLGIAATALLASITCGLTLVGVLVDRASEFSLFAPFDGWQPDLVEAAAGVLVLLVGVGSGWALVRTYRGLRGPSPHRRAVILAALLPGLVLGGAIAAPMRSAVSWASEHTAAAAAARTKTRLWLQQYRQAPPAAPSTRPAAPPGLSARMLHPRDLGAGWYDATRPNPSLTGVSPQVAKLGATQTARGLLTEQHWVDHSWSLDHLLIENLLVFRSQDAAQRYLHDIWERPSTSCYCAGTVGPTTVRRVGSVSVWAHVSKTSLSTRRAAAFVVAGDVFMLSVDVRPGGGPTGADFDKVVAAAVGRALTA